jgi:hypothetical protein
MLNLRLMRRVEPLDAAGLLLRNQVLPVPDREEVANAAARDSQSHAGASVGLPAIGLGRIEAEGHGMLAKLHHDLDQKLHEIDTQITDCSQAIEAQAELVEDERQRVAEKAEARQRILVALDAHAVARGTPLHRLGLSKLSTRDYLVLLAVFGLADTILNVTALLMIGESDLTVWGLAFTLMVAMLWLSHAAGTELRAAEEHRNQGQTRHRQRWAIVCLATLAVFLLAIGSIRAAYLHEQDVQLSNGLLVAVYCLQLLVAVAAIVAAYDHADPDATARRQSEADLEQAQAAEQAEEAKLSELRGQLKAMQLEKVYTERRYVRLGEAALTVMNQLRLLYLTVYLQNLRAVSRPVVEVPLPPIPRPEWMRTRERWVDHHADVHQAPARTIWRHELASPDA